MQSSAVMHCVCGKASAGLMKMQNPGDLGNFDFPGRTKARLSTRCPSGMVGGSDTINYAEQNGDYGAGGFSSVVLKF